MVKLMQGDCIVEIKKLSENSIDTIITDPPYGLSFMGKKWDYDVPSIEIWKEALRVLKPGGTALIFAGSRTQHRMAVNVEDAGFELFDTIAWIYGVGFPKSFNISKSLQKDLECGKMVVYEETKFKSSRNEKEARKTKKIKSYSKSQMSYLLKDVLYKTISFKEGENRRNVQGLLEDLEQGTQYEIFTKSSIRKEIQIPERQRQSCLERWDNIQKEKGELCKCEICKMPTGIFINGKKRWICYGASFSNGGTSWEIIDENGVCSSYKSQSIGQQNKKFNAICKQCGTQKIREWEGFGTALKPAIEPIICARKPNDGTYANNALKWGVSGLNIEQSRITTEENLNGGIYSGEGKCKTVADHKWGYQKRDGEYKQPTGRFPANIILDEEAGRMLDEQSRESKSGKGTGLIPTPARSNMNASIAGINRVGYNDKGGASRFFYCAKTSKSERNRGCEGLGGKNNMRVNVPRKNEESKISNKLKNFHPTVKPLKLMEYLCTLTKTPTGGMVLDPFMGSGTTGIACINTGRDFIGIELDKEYIEIANARIEYWAKQKKLV